MSEVYSNAAAHHLPPDVQQEIRTLCREGYQHFDGADADLALREFFAAWLLIPKPQTHWLESGWVLTAMGDAYLKKRAWSQAAEALRSALHCPEMADNPLCHLRLVEACLELNEVAQARQHAEKAVAGGGTAILSRLDRRYRERLHVQC